MRVHYQKWGKSLTVEEVRIHKCVCFHLLIVEHLVGGSKVSPLELLLVRTMTKEQVACSTCL